MSLRLPARDPYSRRGEAVEDHACGCRLRSVKRSVTRPVPRRSSLMQGRAPDQASQSAAAKVSKKFALPGIFGSLIFGMPLDRRER